MSDTAWTGVPVWLGLFVDASFLFVRGSPSQVLCRVLNLSRFKVERKVRVRFPIGCGLTYFRCTVRVFFVVQLATCVRSIRVTVLAAFPIFVDGRPSSRVGVTLPLYNRFGLTFALGNDPLRFLVAAGDQVRDLCVKRSYALARRVRMFRGSHIVEVSFVNYLDVRRVRVYRARGGEKARLKNCSQVDWASQAVRAFRGRVANRNDLSFLCTKIAAVMGWCLVATC